MKLCAKCKLEKDESEFYTHWHARDQKRRIDSYCKLCTNQKNRDHENSPEGRKSRKDSRLKRLFNISSEMWDAMFWLQGGKCAICQKLFDNPRDIHVDHDHDTKKVRGLLCLLCNTKLDWYIKNGASVQEYLFGPWANLTSESITSEPTVILEYGDLKIQAYP